MGVQGPQDRAEGVVAGDAMLQIQEPPEHILACQGKLLEIGARRGTRQGRRQGDEEDLQQIMAGVVGPGVFEPAKQAFELAHSCLPSWLGDTQRIHTKLIRNPRRNPYAIPLPRKGRGDI